MRKILIYILCLIFICFFIPIFFTSSITTQTNTNTQSNSIDIGESTYNYKNYTKIKLLHVNTDKVEEIKLDEYLYGVVSAEMPASFEEEALKAQAVVARTYTLYKIINNDNKHEKADICDDSGCCQAWISKKDRFSKWDEENKTIYWNKIVAAVNHTQGKIITYNNKPINAFFHANSGGVTEVPINVWGGSDYPYLQSVSTSGEEAYSQYASDLTLTKKEFTDKIKKEHSDFKIDFNKKNCIKVKEYTDGNRVKTITIGNLILSGVEVRNIFGLRSANFKVTINKDDIKFEVTGYRSWSGDESDWSR